MLPAFLDSIVELITRTSTDLPPDVRAAMGIARQHRGAADARGAGADDHRAEHRSGGVVRGTDLPGHRHADLRGQGAGRREPDLDAQQIREAVAEATRRGKLRPNSVDSITGENSGNNLGPGTPIIHFDQWEQPDIEIKLILKGGGCENTNAQYALPTELDHLGRADRTLDGVRKCILHAVWKAQGKGCSPGAVGVCVGGDRTSGYLHAKEQLFRTLDDTNPDPRLAEIEAAVMEEANKLSVGPDGLQRIRRRSSAARSARSTGCRPASSCRSPTTAGRSGASASQSTRRAARSREWLYREGTTPSQPMLSPEAVAAGFPRTGREIPLRAPISEEQIRSLKVGDVVLISGPMFTGRDAVHAHLMKHEPPVDLRGAVLYHCGPVVAERRRQGGKSRPRARRPASARSRTRPRS